MAYNPLLEQFLQERIGNNPQLQAMLAMMQQQVATEAEAEVVESSSITYQNELPTQSEELSKARLYIRKLRGRIAALEARLGEMEENETEMACALGACPICWGEDSSCADCRGRGAPGAQLPNAILFEELIMPAVRRMNVNGRLQ